LQQPAVRGKVRPLLEIDKMWRANRFSRNLALLAGLSILAGCAHDQVTVWTKANVSDDQRYKDLSLCKRYADQQMAGDRGVQQDVQVMNGGVQSGAKPTLGGNIAAYSDTKQYDQLLNDCMTEAGYRAVK
jgi:hypothetical protein